MPVLIKGVEVNIEKELSKEISEEAFMFNLTGVLNLNKKVCKDPVTLALLLLQTTLFSRTSKVYVTDDAKRIMIENQYSKNDDKVWTVKRGTAEYTIDNITLRLEHVRKYFDPLSKMTIRAELAAACSFWVYNEKRYINFDIENRTTNTRFKLDNLNRVKIDFETIPQPTVVFKEQS